MKEKLDRSASKLDRPTSEMPRMHQQPSAFSTKISVSESFSKGVPGFPSDEVTQGRADFVPQCVGPFPYDGGAYGAMPHNVHGSFGLMNLKV